MTPLPGRTGTTITTEGWSADADDSADPLVDLLAVGDVLEADDQFYRVEQVERDADGRLVAWTLSRPYRERGCVTPAGWRYGR